MNAYIRDLNHKKKVNPEKNNINQENKKNKIKTALILFLTFAIVIVILITVKMLIGNTDLVRNIDKFIDKNYPTDIFFVCVGSVIGALILYFSRRDVE